ncbi:hypothetical protein TVAG_303890 [Trichomonas vaginalis G3]|uniref:Uncharacterized protein n=1 Tax=Trichomonas vaginalis (strain ATCC PRA-98 / G3) TaxID=412133 RepID=A2DR70_TRIV3|nr:hypothetical protein TVAGG3_0695710 [Trichomonas vaginalis G3]EAY17169.1 hypothetical protein TVAG_303890 [Trichomonas vaginalis G3]KAI5508900.1 hypothetical protein TVAGG3_0695710 [Trichomonas vaginalis G3]|eukprot:XP_001329392.1 hypothetical protein [Trichomonas vaginalis G3]
MSFNYLFDEETSLTLAKAFKEGKIEDATVIQNNTNEILSKESIPLPEIMKNVVIVMKNSPVLPTIQYSCYESMKEIANKYNVKGCLGYKVADLLFQSQYDKEQNCFKEDSRVEVIMEMINVLDPLTNEDREMAKGLFDTINTALSKDERYADFVNLED